MTAIKLVNKVPESTTTSAEFRLLKGQYMVARVGVHAGGEASVPTQGTGFTAQAVTLLGDFTLTSNEVSFDSRAQVLEAQVAIENGFYDFRLAARQGTHLAAIVCENTWRAPVQFTIKESGTPLEIVTVVDEHNNEVVSTMQQWEIYAIVNGITTGTAAFSDPNATVTLTDNGDDAYALTVELSAEAQASSELKVMPKKAADVKPTAPAKAPEPARTEDTSIEAQVLTVTSAA